jgi:hypothetical protein
MEVIVNNRSAVHHAYTVTVVLQVFVSALIIRNGMELIVNNLCAVYHAYMATVVLRVSASVLIILNGMEVIVNTQVEQAGS